MTVTEIRHEFEPRPRTTASPPRLPRYAIDREAAARARAAQRLRRLVATVGLLWLLGVGGAALGSAMAGLGFQVDRLQARLATDQRQQQALAGEVARLTAAPALAQDAQRLGVALAPVDVASPAPSPVVRSGGSTAEFSLAAAIAHWFAALKQLEAANGR
jgi:hypothetical protein